MSAAKQAMTLSAGERILIESPVMDSFQATVVAHQGWGLVNGELLILCRRDDDSLFTYGIRFDAPVTVAEKSETAL